MMSSKKQFYQFNDEIVTPMKSLHDKRKVSEEQEAKYVTEWIEVLVC